MLLRLNLWQKLGKQPIKVLLKKIHETQNIQLLLKLCSFYIIKISISINANHVTNKKIEQSHWHKIFFRIWPGWLKSQHWFTVENWPNYGLTFWNDFCKFVPTGSIIYRTSSFKLKIFQTKTSSWFQIKSLLDMNVNILHNLDL